MANNFQKQSLILNLFPPPRFLTMPHVGLAISDDFVKLVGLKRKKDKILLASYGKRELPHGVVDRGYVHDKKKLTEVLSGIKDDYGIDFVKVVIPEDKVYLFKIKIPWVKKEEIRSVLEFKIEENAPISASEAIFDFRVTENNKSEDFINLIVTATSSKTIEAYLDALKGAELFPTALGIESQAVCQSVVEAGDNLTHLVLNIEKSKTSLFIMSEGVVQFSSSFHFSFTEENGNESFGENRNLSENSDDPIIIEGNNHKNDPVAKIASQEKKQTGEHSSEFPSWSDSSFTVRLREEIRKVIDYWNTHRTKEVLNAENRVQSIILTGEMKNLEELSSFLSRYDFFEEKVVLGNVWTNVFPLDKQVPPLSFEESLGYASAIGVAIPSLP